jgi:hypothetical protein
MRTKSPAQNTIPQNTAQKIKLIMPEHALTTQLTQNSGSKQPTISFEI